jgi:hypothetical protein
MQKSACVRPLKSPPRIEGKTRLIIVDARVAPVLGGVDVTDEDAEEGVGNPAVDGGIGKSRVDAVTWLSALALVPRREELT